MSVYTWTGTATLLARSESIGRLGTVCGAIKVSAKHLVGSVLGLLGGTTSTMARWGLMVLAIPRYAVFIVAHSTNPTVEWK